MPTSPPPEFLHDNFVLHITPEKFFIEPLGAPNEVLVIDRLTHDIALEKGVVVPHIASRQRVFGVLGTVRLISGPYLVVISRRSKVGEINQCDVWRVDQADVIPYCRTMTHLNENQARYNSEYVSMLETVLRQPHFYFSYTYDLTHNVQRLYNTTPEFIQIPLHERADPRFLWNASLLREFSGRPDLCRFCLPLIHGFVHIRQCSLNGRNFTWTLVSRRSCLRAGTRLFARGVDVEGNVANMVETEQIVESDGDKSSFVQTRGSIPLFWSQYPNLYYKPTPALSDRDNHQEALTLHFDTQLFNYGKQVVINLIDQRGVELRLGEQLARGCQQLNNASVRYEPFDFHHECRKLRWDRLSVLMDRIAPDQDDMGYFLMSRDGTLLSSQEGVFRTNCIDCLDRTNVVQSMVAARQLEAVLQRLAVLREEQLLASHDSFQLLFKGVWADHADLISRQYSGTPALKTDFTRTGKRTVLGAARDGYHSLLRYYMNNFTDGYRQDALDLFLGNYVVEEGEGAARPCPVARPSDWRFPALLGLLVGSFIMFCSILYVPNEYSVETLLYLIFWGLMGYGTVAVIFIYGDEFVQNPRLCPLNSALRVSANRRPVAI